MIRSGPPPVGGVRGWLRRRGFDVIRYNPDTAFHLQRRRIVAERGIDLVLDVGASGGQYALDLRQAGYAGRIVSFEPLEEPFAELSAQAADDPLWDCVRLALGAADESAVCHVAENSFSSSLLTMLDRHTDAAAGSRHVRDEVVTVRRLDDVFRDLARTDDRALLKLDVQGAELRVFDGATAALAQIHAVEAELSLLPLYESQPLIGDVIARLDESGFVLVGLARGFTDARTKQVLQLDGLFVRVP